MKYASLLILLTLFLDISVLYLFYLKMDLLDFLIVLFSSILLSCFILTNSVLRKFFHFKVKDRFSILHLISPFSILMFSILFSFRVGGSAAWLVYLVTILLSLEILLFRTDR